MQIKFFKMKSCIINTNEIKRVDVLARVLKFYFVLGGKTETNTFLLAGLFFQTFILPAMFNRWVTFHHFWDVKNAIVNWIFARPVTRIF